MLCLANKAYHFACKYNITFWDDWARIGEY